MSGSVVESCWSSCGGSGTWVHPVVGETQRHDRRYPRGFSAPLAASVRVPHARRGGGGGGGDSLVGAGVSIDTRKEAHNGPDGLVV